MSSSSSHQRSAREGSPSVTTTADRPALTMSALGKPTNTEAASAPCLLDLAAAGLQLAVGRVVAALAHHVRQHRALAPGHGRPRAAGQLRQDGAPGAQAGLEHVDMRVGLVAGDHGRVLGHGRVQVGVHVQRHADGHLVPSMRAHAAQQFAFAVLDGSASPWRRAGPAAPRRSPGHRLADAPADVSKAASSTGPLGQAAAAIGTS
jgi:hypothetical protein